MPDAKPTSRYRRLYARVESLASSPYALWMMLLVSVVDASVFPVPPFAILVPMVIANPKRWWKLAALGTVASLVGAFLGYQLGHAIHDAALHFFHIDLNAPVNFNWAHVHGTLGGLLGQNFWMVTVLCTLFPIFKVVSISSGAVSVPIFRFLGAAAIGRTLRFFFVAAATALAAVRARKLAEAKSAAAETSPAIESEPRA
jgi:membrane protein YqaA with SNARE-associated domain